MCVRVNNALMSSGAVGKDIKKSAESNSLMSDLSEQPYFYSLTYLPLFTDVDPHNLRYYLRGILISYVNVINIL